MSEPGTNRLALVTGAGSGLSAGVKFSRFEPELDFCTLALESSRFRTQDFELSLLDP